MICSQVIDSKDPSGTGSTASSHLLRPLILLCVSVSLWLNFLVAGSAIAEVPLQTPEELEANATDIVLGVVESREIDESSDGRFLRRAFRFQVRVEETLKGGLAHGAIVPVDAWTQAWIGIGDPPPSSRGHDPLPLDGELVRFFLTAVADDAGVVGYEVLLPNGVELGGAADATDPVRGGDPPRAATSDPATSPAPTKDPFGWEVILLLLAAPILIGSFRQQGNARWILMGIAILLMSGAALVVLV